MILWALPYACRWLLFVAIFSKRNATRGTSSVGVGSVFGCPQKPIKQFGSQSGDANYVLRTLLQLRKTHDKDTHVLFVDLIKAFDTANHELLFKLLVQCGAPKSLVNVIERLHHDFSLKFALAMFQRSEAIICNRGASNMAKNRELRVGDTVRVTSMWSRHRHKVGVIESFTDSRLSPWAWL